MCSSRGLCRGGDRPRSRSSSSGSHYALCALGVGLIALGIVMIVWTVMPIDGESSDTPNTSVSNSSTIVPGSDEEEEGNGTSGSLKTSSVAYVLVGSGAAMLLLSICLGLRNKKRSSETRTDAAVTALPYMDHVTGEEGEEGAGNTAARFDVPTYEEAVGSGHYPVRQSNLRQSTSQLPSYEDLISAVENEGAEPNPSASGGATPSEPSEPNVSPTPTGPTPATAEPDAVPEMNANAPTRSSSRASRLLRPLRVRRIKSDKLHLKDFRLHIRSPTNNPVTIEPITPPPQYEDDKMPELK